METISLCPFTVGTVLWQGHDGAWTLTTCVKGTFTLVHGRDALITEEQEPIGVDRYFAGTNASLYAPSDVVPYKPRTDVVLVGHAYAPKGKPVEALVARLSVGTISKSIGIVGDRLWSEGPYGLEPAHPAPFMKMPLRYERAARAVSNPIGVDLATPPMAGARALPNLEAVDDEAAPIATVGFGPISPGWIARKGLLQGQSLDWVIQGGRGPIPEGFDFSFYNAAPRDQQVDLLRQGAKIVLENLHPDHPRLETRLPQIRPKAFLIDKTTQRGSEVALRCDTVWIDTDRALAIVTWRGLSGVESGDPRTLGTIAVAAELKGKELRFKHIERLLREEGLTSADTESFAMSDVNPLNVRYDGVTLATVPQTADDPPALDLPTSPKIAAPSPPTAPAAPPAPAAGFRWTQPATAITPHTPPPPVEEQTSTELTTQRIKTNEPRLRRAITIAQEQKEAAVAKERGAAAAVAVAAAADDDDASAAPDVPTARISLNPASSASVSALLGASASAPRSVEPASSPNPQDDDGDAETAQMRIKPVQEALAAAMKNASAPTNARGAIPRPAMVKSPPRFGARTEPPPPMAEPPPPVDVPRPAIAKPRSVGLEDYARIVVAVERGELRRIQDKLNMDGPEIARVQAHWAERLRSEPALAVVLEEAVETARWE